MRYNTFLTLKRLLFQTPDVKQLQLYLYHLHFAQDWESSFVKCCVPSIIYACMFTFQEIPIIFAGLNTETELEIIKCLIPPAQQCQTLHTLHYRVMSLLVIYFDFECLLRTIQKLSC